MKNLPEGENLSNFLTKWKAVRDKRVKGKTPHSMNQEGEVYKQAIKYLKKHSLLQAPSLNRVFSN